MPVARWAWAGTSRPCAAPRPGRSRSRRRRRSRRPQRPWSPAAESGSWRCPRRRRPSSRPARSPTRRRAPSSTGSASRSRGRRGCTPPWATTAGWSPSWRTPAPRHGWPSAFRRPEVWQPAGVPMLDDRLETLRAQFAPLPGVLVAFSGGVDSGVVLAAAVRALGADRVVAATAVSPSLPASERDLAAASGELLGVRHEFPRTDELSRAGYRANAGDRCAFCKTELVDVLTPLAARLGIADVVTGTNADDLRAGFRPGIRAATERGAWAPLARVGVTKRDVRAAARLWDLPLADKPAAACLASRIAYGVPVSAEGLARVEQAEAGLRTGVAAHGLPVRDLRVRDLGGDTARVEVDAALVADLVARPELLAAVAGFAAVEVDPRGFRSGSMNELLPDPVRYR